MGIVAPISAVAAVIPFAVGVASGERPGPLQIVGIVLALAGVAVASREPAHRGGGRAAGIGLALLAALGFGLYFVFADWAADESVPYAVATARGVSLLLAFVIALAVGAPLRRGRGFLPVLALVGLCDVGANMLFSLATTRGYLSIVVVLAALYPVVTVALAAIVLHERLAPTQRVGVAGALLGVGDDHRRMRGTLDEHVIASEALRGNPLGDTHERPIWVFTPPSYAGGPAVYVLQGFTGQLDMWRNRAAFRPTFL